MWRDSWNNFGYTPYNPFWGRTDQEDDGREANDFYRVFVNGEYIGDKLSVAQEQALCCPGYLESRGFSGYDFKTEDRCSHMPRTEAVGGYKKILSVYRALDSRVLNHIWRNSSIIKTY